MDGSRLNALKEMNAHSRRQGQSAAAQQFSDRKQSLNANSARRNVDPASRRLAQ